MLGIVHQTTSWKRRFLFLLLFLNKSMMFKILTLRPKAAQTLGWMWPWGEGQRVANQPPLSKYWNTVCFEVWNFQISFLKLLHSFQPAWWKSQHKIKTSSPLVNGAHSDLKILIESFHNIQRSKRIRTLGLWSWPVCGLSQSCFISFIEIEEKIVSVMGMSSKHTHAHTHARLDQLHS